MRHRLYEAANLCLVHRPAVATLDQPDLCSHSIDRCRAIEDRSVFRTLITVRTSCNPNRRTERSCSSLASSPESDPRETALVIGESEKGGQIRTFAHQVLEPSK